VTGRSHPVARGAGVLLAVLVLSGLVWATVDTGHGHTSGAGTRSTTATQAHRHPTSSLPAPAGQWKPVPPATTVPPQTPVQLQYDSAFESGLAPTMAGAEAAAQHLPAPSYSGGWQALPESPQPGQWVTSFTNTLLGIDFAGQTRVGLGHWLVANEAPEMVPGVVPSVQNAVLYLSVFDPSAAGGTTSPVPSAVQWQADAAAGVTWSASQLLVEMDPQWSQIIASGWEPTDTRLAEYDVSGVLTVTQPGQPPVPHHFSMQGYVGSAHWHQGYGTVAVSSWSEG
jgi:hypothetical protein